MLFLEDCGLTGFVLKTLIKALTILKWGGGGGGRGCKTELCWLNKWKFASKCFNSLSKIVGLDTAVALAHTNGC